MDHYLDLVSEQPTLLLNGQPMPFNPENGYLTIERKWSQGDRLELNLPMIPRLVASHEAVAANRGCLALERGPLVYAFSSLDNPTWPEVRLTPSAQYALREVDGLPQIAALSITRPGKLALVAIPYFARANRAACELRTWLPAVTDDE